MTLMAIARPFDTGFNATDCTSYSRLRGLERTSQLL